MHEVFLIRIKMTSNQNKHGLTKYRRIAKNAINFSFVAFVLSLTSCKTSQQAAHKVLYQDYIYNGGSLTIVSNAFEISGS